MSIQKFGFYSFFRISLLLLLLQVISGSAVAQPMTGDAMQKEEVSWPHRLTLGLGAGLNLNFASGDYTVFSAAGDNVYTSGFGAAPTFYALLEIPLAESWMLVPRIHYSDYSASFTDGKLGKTAGQLKPNFAYSMQTIGVDILGKYSFSGFHILFGPSIATMIKKTYSQSSSSAASSSDSTLPGAGSLYATIGAGIGYDIPINAKHSVWLTPEVFYSIPLTNLGPDNGSLKASTLRAALSIKFDIGSDPLPPPAMLDPLEATISAKGILPNGDLTNEPIIPEQASRTRSSMQMLPYIFFDNNSAEIPARYTRSGSTGFSEMGLAGKNEIEVNHAALDIWGARMKQYPSITIKVTGCNSNSGAERGKIDLSKQRALAIRDYLVNTWGIDGKR
ncbi:MAG: outer membrane beta-barrel protein, partial [Ignavibacteriota bacterium]